MKFRNTDTGRVFDTDVDHFPTKEFFESADNFELVEEEPVKAPAKKAASSRTRKQA